MFNKIIVSILPLMPPRLVWIFSKRYIAGKTIDDAISASKVLNSNRMMVTIDILGEFIKTISEAERNRDDYLRLIDIMEKDSIDGNYSIKPTMFGLLIDEELCYEYIRAIVEKASLHNTFIRIDMEDSACTTKTINLYRRLYTEFPKNCGLVVQAYLKRTRKDLQELEKLNTEAIGLNYRLCKGIYVEPAEIAFKSRNEINENYLYDLEFMFFNKHYVGIATHDKKLVEGAYALIEKYRVPKDRYEFQMLFGVTPELRKSIVAKGHKLRVYVPFGKKWFGYSTRRLKENPKMALLIIKALFVRG